MERKDFAVILNYTADKGTYTKITSNGTMPLARAAPLGGIRSRRIRA